ncbi:MAG: IS1634 family transposase, partial [Actinobacteria bacterium]|nr:IS1634 family transposase [Actinomycetota bacterium]
MRRSYREGGKVRHENLGNLSHLPAAAIEVLRRALAGEVLVGAQEVFQTERSLPHGHVAAVLGVLRDLDLERLLGRERCRERDLVVGLICQRLIGPGSKLSATRRFQQTTLADQLSLGQVKEAELMGALDWLSERQERIEAALARRHLAGEGFVLYDLSSSYVEGRCCPLAAVGYSRDGKRGKAQITYGLVCAPDGRPVSITVYPGNTNDSTTLGAAVAAVRERFAIEHVVMVGDRGMITKTRAQELKNAGVGFVTALTAPQIAALRVSHWQLSLFDEQGLAEISSPDYPDERLVVCRNPAVAAERARKRSALLAATETELERVCQSVHGPRGRLKNADAAKIGQRAGKVIAKYKMAKHFELDIKDQHFSYQRKTAQIADEALLDGIYVLRTPEPKSRLGAPAVVRVYKQLKVAERAFNAMKSPEIEIRPIYHHLETRVRAHTFLCMLAYYVQFELRQRLKPLLFDDETPSAPTNPVAPATRSPAAHAKAGSHTTTEGHPAHDLADLLADLGTLCRNRVRVAATDTTFHQLTTPTPL